VKSLLFLPNRNSTLLRSNTNWTLFQSKPIWTCRSYTDSCSVRSDWLANIVFKGSVLSAGSIRFHGYPSISGETHLLFRQFLCNGLLVLRFHWSIHFYRSRCLSKDVLFQGFLVARHTAPFLRLFIPNSLTVFPFHLLSASSGPLLQGCSSRAAPWYRFCWSRRITFILSCLSLSIHGREAGSSSRHYFFFFLHFGGVDPSTRSSSWLVATQQRIW
jgi:hypothetical protein